jgi:hypothetical protein
MTELVDFLKARLAEDEQAARDAPGLGRWEVQGYHVYDPSTPKSLGPVASNAIGYARHIARHDPARVLREVERDRGIIDILAEDAGAASGEVTQQDFGGELDRWMRATAVLRLLASVYDTHPDYRKEWALS